MPAKNINKGELTKLLVEERKKSRIKHQESAFKKRTLSIYNGQKRRAAEEKPSIELDYSLEDLRDYVRNMMEEFGCYYSNSKLTVANLALDHRIPISRGGTHTLQNLVVCTKVENFRKGSLTGTEYDQLKAFVGKLDPAAQKDIWTRLTTGGKWMPGR